MIPTVHRSSFRLPPTRVLILFSALGLTVGGLVPSAGGQEESVSGSAGAQARILAGPDVPASRDGAFPHVEPTLAAHPRDPEVLVGAAMTFPRPDEGVACRVYASRDGGSSWTVYEPEEHVDDGLGDPQVAFTPRGTALFACLTEGRRESGRPRAALRVYRSEDGGLSWQGPADAGSGSYDHPVIAVDHTTGAHAGNVYFGVLHGRREAILSVFRSEDDGESFIGPVEAVRSAEDGLLVVSLGVLSDGTLVLTYSRTRRGSGSGGELGTSRLEMVTSKDGGITFSEPSLIATRTTRPRSRTEESLVSRLDTVAMGWTPSPWERWTPRTPPPAIASTRCGAIGGPPARTRRRGPGG